MSLAGRFREPGASVVAFDGGAGDIDVRRGGRELGSCTGGADGSVGAGGRIPRERTPVFSTSSARNAAANGSDSPGIGGGNPFEIPGPLDCAGACDDPARDALARDDPRGPGARPAAASRSSRFEPLTLMRSSSTHSLIA